MSVNKGNPFIKTNFKKRYLLIPLVAICFFLYIRYSITTREELNNLSRFECLFCNLTNVKRMQRNFEFENDEYVILKDIKPASTYHYLAIPKEHLHSIKVLNKSHVGLVERMQEGLTQLLESKGVNVSSALIGFHIPPFISQKHLHLHGISPTSEMGLSDRISFFMPSFWFTTANDVLESLQRSEL